MHRTDWASGLTYTWRGAATQITTLVPSPKSIDAHVVGCQASSGEKALAAMRIWAAVILVAACLAAPMPVTSTSVGTHSSYVIPAARSNRLQSRYSQGNEAQCPGREILNREGTGYGVTAKAGLIAALAEVVWCCDNCDSSTESVKLTADPLKSDGSSMQVISGGPIWSRVQTS
jgi:hypothetical protein